MKKIYSILGIIFIATSFYVAQLVFAAGDYSIVMKVPYYTMNNANTPTGTFESKFNFNDQNYISVKSVKYSVGAALQQPIDARSDGRYYTLTVPVALIGPDQASVTYSDMKSASDSLSVTINNTPTDISKGQIGYGLLRKTNVSDQSGRTLSPDITTSGKMLFYQEYLVGTDGYNKVDPGNYTVTISSNGKVINSFSFCLPSFTSTTGVKVGNVVCNSNVLLGQNTNSNTSTQSGNSASTTTNNQTTTQTANGGTTTTTQTATGGTNNQATQGTQSAQGGITPSYTVTIGNPIFIKGANNDLAQFNVPLLYKLPADPTNKTKVNGSLQTVIYKKNELKKVEESAPFGTQNVIFNTQSLWSYQWAGLTSGNEYVIYFYDKTTGSKSSYVSLKYGADGKLAATIISTLPSWTSGVTTPANGGVANPTSSNGLTFNFLPDVYLQTLKAKGSVKFTGTNTGTLGGAITLTPVAYNGTKLTTETFTILDTTVEPGNTYPFEFTFKQKLPIGVSVSKIEVDSSNVTVTPRATPQSSGTTDVITGSDGKKTTFSITKAEYDAGKKTIALVGNITYTDDFVATNKYNKILADIYSGGTKTSTKNIIFTKTATGKLDFNSVITDVDPSKKPDSFKIRDTSAEITSKSFSIPTGTGNGNGSAIQTSGLIRFSAKSTTYTGTTISGSITPTVQGSDLKIKGELTYFKVVGNPATADVKNAGRISFHLIDGENKVSQIKVDQLADGIPLQYDIPYQFEITFPNYNRYLDQEGVPTNLTTRPVPFKLQIIEDQLSAKSEALTVVSTAQQSGNQSFNTDSLTASDGTKVKFAFNSKDPVATSGKTEIMFDGSVTYSSFANTSKLGKLQFVTYDKSSKIVKTESLELMQSVIDENMPQAFTESLTIDSVNGPFTIKIKDTGLGVESKSFSLSKINSNNGNNSSAQSDSATVQSGPGAGTKIDFNVTPYYKESTSQAWADASVTYHFPDKSKDYSGGTTVFNLYDKDGGLVGTKTFGELQVLVDDNEYKFNASTLVFDNATPAKAPFTLKVVEKDFNVTSKAFSVNKTNGNPGDNSNDNTDQPADQSGTSQNRISLMNPLKDGLDSIPAIVAVLVRDIVIPIAVPFLALAIIYTGFLFVQARGNADKLKEAKAALKWTLIGGAIILGAYVIATALQATIADIVR